jgi:hypothetical protein
MGLNGGKISFKKGDEETIVIQLLSANSTVQVVFTGTTTALPYTLSVDYTTMATPANSASCKVSIQSELPKTAVELGSTLCLQTKVTNTQSAGLPSTMCIIGIPGGCSVQRWQLKELMDNDVVDHYELRNHQLICYFRGLAPNKAKTIISIADLENNTNGENLKNVAKYCSYEQRTRTNFYQKLEELFS